MRINQIFKFNLTGELEIYNTPALFSLGLFGFLWFIVRSGLKAFWHRHGKDMKLKLPSAESHSWLSTCKGSC